jgi:hypothetical protein
MKIRVVVADFPCERTDRQIERRDEANSRF